MSLDLRHVESFVAVADSLSFSVAAERTATVQSAISEHIRLLERRLGRRLVERGRGRPVSLTAEGLGFLVHARRLLALADEATHGPRDGASTMTLRLGSTVTFALSVVPEALAIFARERPDVAVSVTTARSHDFRGLLDDNAIDLALVLDQGPHPGRLETVSVPLVWAAAKSFAHDPRTPLPLAFLADARDLRRHALAALDGERNWEVALRTHADPVGLRATLLAGLATTVLPQPAVVPPLCDIGPLPGTKDLARVPVSIYGTTGSAGEVARGLATHLLSGLGW